MALTRLQLRTRIASNIGGRIDKDTVINEGLDMGLEEINLRHQFRRERTETDLSIALAARSVALPTSSFQLIEARFVDTSDQDGMKIDVLSKRQFVDKYPTTEYETAGKPDVGYVENGTLHVNRPTDAAYTIRVTTHGLPSLSLDTSTPSSLGINHTLICWVTSYMMAHLEQFQESREWEGRYERSLREAIRADKREVAREPQHQRVKGRGGLPSQYWLIWDIAKVK